MATQRRAEKPTRGRTRGTAKLSRTEKIGRKLKNLTKPKSTSSKSLYTINVWAKRPVEIQGILIEENDFGIRLLHKKSSGSAKPRMSFIPNSDILEMMGTAGEATSVTVMREEVVQSIQKATVAVDKDGSLKVVDSVTKETSRIRVNANTRLEIFCDTLDTPVSASGRGRRSKTATPAAKRRASASTTRKKPTRSRKL